MTGQRPVRVLIVEDSATTRHCLRETLTADPGIVVVGEAVDGAQAVRLCDRLRPDVVTMDVVLPGMDGLAATAEIMWRVPTPILVVSAGERAEAFTTYDALAAGAVDVMDKPRGDATDDGWAPRLRAAGRVVARVRVRTRHRRPPEATPQPWPAGSPPASPAESGPGLAVVAVGASTGGPAAAVRLIRSLPARFRVPVLLVQHMSASETLAVAYADWLAGQVSRPVSYARGGEPLATLAGRVVVAPPGRHLVVRHGAVAVTSEVERHSCRPSVDALFESVAAGYGARAAGCLLTGMGRDGAQGLLTLRRAGGRTLAQDEHSSVVYGMPGAAVEIGAAEQVLPPDRMAARLATLAATGGSGGR